MENTVRVLTILQAYRRSYPSFCLFSAACIVERSRERTQISLPLVSSVMYSAHPSAGKFHS